MPDASNMPPHVHPGDGFEDLDVSDRPGLERWHVAYRVGAVGEESADALASFIPLSLSYSEPEVGASMRTIKYGLVRDFWRDRREPSDEDVHALIEAALNRLPADIAAMEGSKNVVDPERHFVRPSG